MNGIATNGVDFFEKFIVKDLLCHRFIFCDFSGQERLYPILQGYMQSIQAAILVVDGSDRQTLHYIFFNECCCYYSFTFLPIKSFYLPTLQEIHGNGFPVYIVINKSDLVCTVKKRDVHLICKSFSPTMIVSSIGQGMKKNINSLFKSVMKNLLIDKNEDGCTLFI